MDQPGAVAQEFSVQDRSEPAVVLQASGMLAARLGISCTAALDRMRRYATRADRPLLEVAEAVVVDRSVDLRE
jgi:AmiR/NasT family two-component response regulator